MHMEVSKRAGEGSKNTEKHHVQYFAPLTFLPLFDCLADLDSVCIQDSQ